MLDRPSLIEPLQRDLGVITGYIPRVGSAFLVNTSILHVVCESELFHPSTSHVNGWTVAVLGQFILVEKKSQLAMPMIGRRFIQG